MTISQMLLPEFDQELANTRKLLERVPADKYGWKPHDKSMTLGRLAGHIADLPRRAVSVIAHETFEVNPGAKPFIPESAEELLAALDQNATEARAAIAGASDEHLAVEWSIVFMGRKVLSAPRFLALRFVFMNHMIHHRAQLGVYLRENGVAIPGMYGPSADDQLPS